MQIEIEYKIWLFYVSTQAKLKHDYEIIDTFELKGINLESSVFFFKKGRDLSKLIPIGNNFNKIHYWKDIKIQSFDEFINEKGFYNYNHWKSIYDYEIQLKLKYDKK